MADSHSDHGEAQRTPLAPLVAVSDPAALQCCCGRTDCVFLKHNCSVLDSVEKDVHTAAKMGQALLARHEAYMASAERDRVDMQSRIEQLEMDKKSLEAENARTIEENRALLDQLEQLNSTVSDSETRIRSLEATLQSSQQAIRRLEGSDARAEELERHLAALEAEQAALQNTLITTESEARSAMQRWRKAERGISTLQSQLEMIEREAREERERHVEVLGRMERQRAVEKDLNTAAGRLKGAAAAKSLTDGKNGSSVVSHFVRDLLQDNASLQVSIAELREMLWNSNDEIQLLREQLMLHQPLPDGEVSAASTLRAELEPQRDQSPTRLPAQTNISQELHVHHHYHVTSKMEPRKPKKKRYSLTPGIFTPPPASSPSSLTNGDEWQLAQSSPATPMTSHATRDSVSTIPSNRWSVLSEQPSEFAPSSVPSSPVSNKRTSMFDPANFDASLPASPTTSVDPLSPTLRARHRKQTSDMSARSFAIPTPLQLGAPSHEEPPMQTPHAPGHTGLAEPIDEEEDVSNVPNNVPDLTETALNADDSNSTETSTATPSDFQDPAFSDMALSPSLDGTFADQITPRPRLHRAMSHESIISLAGGLDIHTLKARPSQLTLRPLGASIADIGLSAVTAMPTISRGGDDSKRGSNVLRESLLGLPVPRMANRAVSGPVSPSRPSVADGQRQASSTGLGKWVGWRPWGGNAAASASIALDSSSTSGSVGSSSTKSANDQKAARDPASDKGFSRASGINQAGAIPGFYEYWATHQKRTPSKVHPDVVDQDALREVLEE